MLKKYLVLLLICISRGYSQAQECGDAIGLSDGRIHDGQFTASSYLAGYHPSYARLNRQIEGGCWSPNIVNGGDENNPWITVVFEEAYQILSVDIQDVSEGPITFVFDVEYLPKWDTYHKNWRHARTYIYAKRFRQEILSIETKPIIAKSVRIKIRDIGPFKEIPCLRLELYGCKECTQPIGISDERFHDKQFYSSSFTRSLEPYFARLNGSTGWCPRKRDYKPWIEVNLKVPYIISEVQAQGKADFSTGGYLDTFTIDYFDYYKQMWVLGTSYWIGPKQLRLDTSKCLLNEPTYMTKIRINPKVWRSRYSNNIPCVRMELIGCKCKS